ncbi:hypothetical protein BDV95DRAFT_575704 [Massariosphaeria phaeospora]|uniref:Uncharacterized protein n=1 Tax=Massariosphaeria phaeospora TaxID=100035 RepID=A0A7C8MM87_9PLEO|nr:hypothetical protein BDV95DRAFT_575704 [Massariosphaeria phaeospora]
MIGMIDLLLASLQSGANGAISFDVVRKHRAFGGIDPPFLDLLVTFPPGASLNLNSRAALWIRFRGGGRVRALRRLELL